VKLLTAATASITAGRIAADAKTLAAVESLMHAVKGALPATVTPATVRPVTAAK
jgi:hypothetical protein